MTQLFLTNHLNLSTKVTLLRFDRTFILLAQFFFVNISCYAIWLSLGLDYGILRGCEETIEFYFAVVIVIALSQALQIYRRFFFVKF